jgi:hypothetical protein
MPHRTCLPCARDEMCSRGITSTNPTSCGDREGHLMFVPFPLVQDNAPVHCRWKDATRVIGDPSCAPLRWRTRELPSVEQRHTSQQQRTAAEHGGRKPSQMVRSNMAGKRPTRPKSLPAVVAITHADYVRRGLAAPTRQEILNRMERRSGGRVLTTSVGTTHHHTPRR